MLQIENMPEASLDIPINILAQNKTAIVLETMQLQCGTRMLLLYNAAS